MMPPEHRPTTPPRPYPRGATAPQPHRPAPPPPPMRSLSRPPLATRLLAFLWGALRAQPITAAASFALVFGAGWWLLYTATPVWTARAEIAVPPSLPVATTPEDEPSDATGRITAEDLGEHLRSRVLQDDARSTARTAHDPSKRRDLARREKARRWWNGLVTGPRRLLGSLSGPGRAEADDPFADFASTSEDSAAAGAVPADADSRTSPGPRIEFAIRVPSDRAVLLAVRASRPELAEAAAAALFERACTELEESRLGPVRDRRADLLPRLADAQATLAAGLAERSALQVAVGTQDPVAFADAVERRLADVRTDHAGLATERLEARRQHEEVVARLAEVEPVIHRTVVVDNPRLPEIRREIADIQRDYDALVHMTERHPRKQALRTRLDSLERELEIESSRVIEERIEEPNVEHRQLVLDRVRLEQEIDRLAAREAGLAESVTALEAELERANHVAARMQSLNREIASATEQRDRVRGELDRVEAVLAEADALSRIRPVEPPQVRDARRPDEPHGGPWIARAFLAGLAAMVAVPVARSLLRPRLLNTWGIDDLAATHGVEVLGEMPAGPGWLGVPTQPRLHA